jgi:RTX calcium-binding nonapeptide repeat (4 copies)
MYRKTRKTLFARVRSDVIGQWTGHRIMGADGKDQLDGLAGNDIIEGGAGDDTINADGLIKAGYLNSVAAQFHGNDFADGGAGDDEIQGGGNSDQLFGGAGDECKTIHYEFRSCLRPYLLVKTSIRYLKTARKSSPEPCASRMRARSGIRITPSSTADRVSKQFFRLIQVSNLLLLISICVLVSSDADAQEIININKSTVVQLNCNSHDLHGNEPLQVNSIAGLYRLKVDLPAHIAFPSDGKPTGFNYLAITAIGGNVLRVRLTTKEINGHSCGFDSQAVLCGRTIRLLPSDEDKSALENSKQLIPSLQVTTSHISFTPNADGTVISGSPYCGKQGALNHRFSRTTRNLQINNSVFNQ